MGLQPDLQTIDSLCQSSMGQCGPYEPSIASSASSSQASIFSESSSVQSSIASSISDDFRYNQEDARDRALAQQQVIQKALIDNPSAALEHAKLGHLSKTGGCPFKSTYADITSVPRDQRQHPRRCSLSRNQKPPPLVRQSERKTSFVESLVDSATQMVEVMWPLSVVPCKSEGGSGRGVLPLRTYIEETLRRSRTSYSTLQVALYYLVLIKPYVPKTDFTQEQGMDCPSNRALMCGRRMFLAALILASKYLQDRNYSAKAWSKMSGLKVAEINSNERTFLSKIDWRLHIREPIFKKWTEIVLKYSPDPLPPSPGQSIETPTWRDIVPQLTAELDTIPIPESMVKGSMQCFGNYGLASPTTPTPSKHALNAMQMSTTSHEGTPTPQTVVPRFLEPKLDMAPPTPAFAPHMGPLPTPQLTPSSVAPSTPAVSACGSRRPSISSAMAMAQQSGFIRCAIDTFPGSRPPMSRRPSIASATSTRSTPESMISDNSRSSRASSISSISTVSSTSSLAPNRACLARQATCRNAGLPLPATVMQEKEGSANKPIVISDDVEIVSSPAMADFTVSEKALHAPHKHSKHATQATSSPSSAEKSRKRGRPRGNRRSNLQDEVRWGLEDYSEDCEVVNLVEDDDDVLMLDTSPAVQEVTKELSRSNSVIHTKEMQPPARLSRSDSCRMPVQRNESSKRSCCSSSAMSISPAPLYGEVA